MAITPRRSPLFIAALTLVTLLWPPGVRGADSPWQEASEFASGTGGALFVGAGLISPLLTDAHDGETRSLRAADAFLTSSLICEALKAVVAEERPDGSSGHAFPSSHTTAAFAIAEMQGEFRPNQRWLWYAGAALIGASRIELNRHYWWDVVAGAALGYGVARWELSRPRGLLLSPVIRPERGGASVALTLRF